MDMSSPQPSCSSSSNTKSSRNLIRLSPTSSAEEESIDHQYQPGPLNVISPQVPPSSSSDPRFGAYQTIRVESDPPSQKKDGSLNSSSSGQDYQPSQPGPLDIIPSQQPLSSSCSQRLGAYQTIRVESDGPNQKKDGSLSNSSSHDGTIIREIPEDGQGECSSISGILRYCKRRILYPYLKLLGIMGLKPLNADSSDLCTCSLILNKMYIVVVTILLLVGYTLQYLTCFRRDRGFSYKAELFETIPYDISDLHREDDRRYDYYNSMNQNDTTSFVSVDDEFGELGRSTTTIEPEPEGHFPGIQNICSGNLIYVHLIPSSLHFISFIYMIYLYWLNHDEQLQNLMERVFIQATQAHCTFFSPRKVLRPLKFLVMFGTVWLVLSAACLVIQVYLHQIVINFWETSGRSGTCQTSFLARRPSVYAEWIIQGKTMGGLMGFSTLWQDAIQVTVIISYCIHCHLLSTYLDFIHSRISQHSINLAECIKEIAEIDKLLQYINCKLASGLLPLLLLDAIFFISSLTYLLGHGTKLGIHDLAIQTVISLLWMSLLLMPLLQAARLSTGLKKVRELGHLVRMRPFGYQEYQQSDLDSFLLFVSTVKMDVRICKMPLSATSLARFASLSIFALFLWGYLHPRMPELFDGVPEFSQLTKAIIPDEWLGGIWPRYKIFSYRCMERGFGGHPILLPQTIWPWPRRDVPMIYAIITIDTTAFFVGFCAGIYITYRNSYITRDLDFELSKHIYFDREGLEIGGTPRDWIEWIIQDRYNVVKVLRRTFSWAFGGGLLHCLSCYWYRILFQSQGHLIPMLFTSVFMTVGDLEFMTNYRTIGNACYMACCYDFIRLHFVGGNSTFFAFNFTKKYFGNPFCFLFYPPGWLYAMMPI